MASCFEIAYALRDDPFSMALTLLPPNGVSPSGRAIPDAAARLWRNAPLLDFTPPAAKLRQTNAVRVFLALFAGILIGAGALWIFGTQQGRTVARDTATRVDTATKSARDSLQDRMQQLDLRPEDIREELARSGQVVRRKAQEAGTAIADATADARVTAAIKGKLLTHRELSAMNISVNTTAGVVTLSGAVDSQEEIGQAVVLAMETEGVREVISTLQVIQPKKKP